MRPTRVCKWNRIEPRVAVSHHGHAVGDSSSPTHTSADEGSAHEAVRHAESCPGERERRDRSGSFACQKEHAPRCRLGSRGSCRCRFERFQRTPHDAKHKKAMHDTALRSKSVRAVATRVHALPGPNDGLTRCQQREEVKHEAQINILRIGCCVGRSLRARSYARLCVPGVWTPTTNDAIRQFSPATATASRAHREYIVTGGLFGDTEYAGQWAPRGFKRVYLRYCVGVSVGSRKIGRLQVLQWRTNPFFHREKKAKRATR